MRRRGQVGVTLLAAVALTCILATPAAAQPQPPATTPPATSPAPDPTPPADGQPDDCDNLGNELLDTFCRGASGPADVPSAPDGLIAGAISAFFRNLTAEAIPAVAELIGQHLLTTPQLTDPDQHGRRVRELWGYAAGITNTGYVLLVVAGGVLLMSHETLQTRYAIKDAAPRLVVAFALSNLSLFLLGYGIDVANALSLAFTRFGQNVGPEDLRPLLEAATRNPGIIGSQIFGTFAVVVVVLGFLLYASYVVRVALLIMLTVAAPLALATYALPHTEKVAQLWGRATAATLAAQIGQSLALTSALHVLADGAISTLFGASAFANVVVTCCLLWLLVRIPLWAFRTVWSGNPGRTVLAAAYITYQLWQRVQRGRGGGQVGGQRRTVRQ